MAADVRDVERRRPRQRHLRADVPLQRRRELRVVIEDRHRGGRLRDESRLSERLQVAVPDVGGDADGRVAHLVVNSVAVQAIEEHAESAANDHALRAGHVVGRAEPRGEPERRPRVVGFRDAVASHARCRCTDRRCRARACRWRPACSRRARSHSPDSLPHDSPRDTGSSQPNSPEV